jgi:hypothetical protein
VRPVRYAQELYTVCARRSMYLRTLVPSAPVPFSRELDRNVSFVVIEVMNNWASFSRTLYLTTCRGARDSRRQRLTINRTFGSDDEALHFAIARYKPHFPAWPTRIRHRNEPDWISPNTLLTLINDLNASNAGDVSAALSFQGRVLRDLPTVRNFYAHRQANSAKKARRLMINYGIPPNLHPTDFCLSYESGMSQSILLNWLDELLSVQELAVT